MKKVLIFAVIVLTVALIAALKQASYANHKWEEAMANVKAYDVELSYEKNKSTAYKMSIEQLKTFQDSILKELYATSKKLKIKEKNLKSLQYVTSSFSKTDTIVLNDTIFKEPSFALDTLLGDNWYSVSLGLKYPSEISVNPMFRSDKYIVVSSRKETVNPPKKFFLARWFQKKHYVIRVDVEERNPYIDEQKSRYIEITE